VHKERKTCCLLQRLVRGSATLLTMPTPGEAGLSIISTMQAMTLKRSAPR